METIFEYIGAGAMLIIVLYIFIKFITTRPADKYYNNSWKNRHK